jgi:hypothetical protein
LWKRTLFAGFCFNLVKMVCDCVLVARAAIVKTGVGMVLVGSKGDELRWDILGLAGGNAKPRS